MTSFFGGDHTKSHFSVHVADGDHSEVNRLTALRKHDEARAERDRLRDERREQTAKLKAAGLPTTRYFQYRNSDAAGKLRQRAAAVKEAVRIEKLTGVKMQVSEGFFL